MENAVPQAVCNEKHKALENYLSNDKAALAKQAGEIKDVQEAIVVLTEIQRRHETEIDDHEGRLRGIEAKPAKRWEGVVGQIVQLIIAAAAGGAIAKFF